MLDKIGDYIDKVKDAIESIEKFAEEAADLLDDIFSGGMIENISVYNIDEINTSMDKCVSALGTYTSSIYDILIPIGCMFIFIFFCVEIIEQLMDDSISLEKLVKTVIKCVVGMLVMSNGYSIIMQVYDAVCAVADGSITDIFLDAINGISVDMSNSVVGKSTDIEDIVGESLDEFIEAIVDSLFGLISSLCWSLIYVLMGIVAYLFIGYQIMMRAVKISIYVALSPLAMANFFGDFNKSEAIKHFKKIISLFLQGPIILLIIKLSTYLIYGSISVYTNSIGSGLLGFIMIFIMIAGIIGSEKTAEEMVGL